MEYSFSYWGAFCPRCGAFFPLYEAEKQADVYVWVFPDIPLTWKISCRCENCDTTFPCQTSDLWLVNSSYQVKRYTPTRRKRQASSTSEDSLA